MPSTHAENQSHYVPSLRVIELEKENRLLRKRVEEQDQEIAVLKQEIQDLKLRVAELAELLFRQKKSKKENDKEGTFEDGSTGQPSAPRTPRSTESYRRPAPSEGEVTKREEYTLQSCTHCGGHLEKLEVRNIFTEDIPEVKKEVIQRIINRYLCNDCRLKQSAIPVPPGHDVRLGSRVRKYVLYHTYILNTSYRDIIRSLLDYYGMHISEGEIQEIQQESAQKLTPTYNGIHEELLQQEAINGDETGWKIKGERNYLWGLCSPTTTAILFHIATRGKGVIEKLLRTFSGCLTTDCYPAYKNLLNLVHQVCWVHILRTVRDLACMPELSAEQTRSVKNFYAGLAILYQDVKDALAEPFDEKKRSEMSEQFITRLRALNPLLPCDTPKKLKNIKLLTQEYEREMFTCLKFKTALPENNLAERALRHVVLKRKRSFGSQTEKGARIFAINASVILTLWRRFPNTFLLELGKALR